MDAPLAVPPPDDRALHRLLIVLLAVLLLAGALPLFATALVYRFFHSLRVAGLLAAAVAAVASPALLLVRPSVAADASGEPRHGALAAVALVWALLAVALTAQTLVPTLLVQAQANTLPYLVLQPAAFLLVEVTVGALIARPARVRAAPLAPARILIALLAGVAVAVVFLSGETRPPLPGPLWFAIKSAAAAGLVLFAARGVEAWQQETLVRAAWAAVFIALLNVALTAAVLAVRRLE